MAGGHLGRPFCLHAYSGADGCQLRCSLPAIPCLPDAVDCLAVTEHSMRSMGEAAKAFCAALTERCPGSKVAASSLGRLPASADADAAPIGHAHERKRTPAATASMHWRPA